VCVARKALGDRTVPTDAMNLAPVAYWRKASQTGRARAGPVSCSGFCRDGVAMDQMALSIIWVS
jgi:hypothetical protein